MHRRAALRSVGEHRRVRLQLAWQRHPVRLIEDLEGDAASIAGIRRSGERDGAATAAAASDARQPDVEVISERALGEDGVERGEGQLIGLLLGVCDERDEGISHADAHGLAARIEAIAANRALGMQLDGRDPCSQLGLRRPFLLESAARLKRRRPACGCSGGKTSYTRQISASVSGSSRAGSPRRSPGPCGR